MVRSSPPARAGLRRSSLIVVTAVLVALAVACASNEASAPTNNGNTATVGTGAPVASPGTAPPLTTADAALERNITAARAQFPPGDFVIHRIVAEGDLVALHLERATPAPPQAQVAVLRFDPAGSIVDRSVVTQNSVERTPGGHTMFDGAGDPSAPADLAANKAVVQRLYTDVFNGKRLEVIDEVIAPDYVQHNPLIGDGAAALKAGLGAGMANGVEEMIAQGDLVAVRVAYGPISAVDIFRIENGRIAEHWDVLQLTP